ncbi:hypothetical protein MRB53_036847 [Persea americana]|nr:hypothetical protein MRB53_036847 [Persea americana]
MSALISSFCNAALGEDGVPDIDIAVADLYTLKTGEVEGRAAVHSSPASCSVVLGCNARGRISSLCGSGSDR